MYNLIYSQFGYDLVFTCTSHTQDGTRNSAVYKTCETLSLAGVSNMTLHDKVERYSGCMQDYLVLGTDTGLNRTSCYQSCTLAVERHMLWWLLPQHGPLDKVISVFAFNANKIVLCAENGSTSFAGCNLTTSEIGKSHAW